MRWGTTRPSGGMSASDIDTAATDHLLTTTRAVRKRLDVARPVGTDVIEECLGIATQAPTGSNTQGWRWIVVRDPERRAALAEIYRRGADAYLAGAKAGISPDDHQTQRVYASAFHLVDVLADVPVHVVPCILGRFPDGAPPVWSASLYGSIFPAVWSFQLALRSRGLGSCLTTLHLVFEAEAVALLEIPDTVTQVGLVPVAYYTGDTFRPVDRSPLEEITYWDAWNWREAGAD